MGSKPKVQTVAATVAPRSADDAVQEAGTDARRRYGAAGQSQTLLTGGEGDIATPATRKKTLLGQ